MAAFLLVLSRSGPCKLLKAWLGARALATPLLLQASLGIRDPLPHTLGSHCASVGQAAPAGERSVCCPVPVCISPSCEH